MNTIAIMSVKGGVGKTTSAVNLATALSGQCNKKVLLVDTNVQAPNVGLHIGVAKTENGLEDVLQNKHRIQDAIYTHAYGFDVLLPNIGKATNLKRLKNKLRHVQRAYDFILLDTTPTFAREYQDALKSADKVLVVTTPDVATLALTQKSLKQMEEQNKPVLGVICNRATKNSLNTKQIEQVLGLPVIATLADSHKIPESIAKVTPVVKHHPNSKTARSYVALAKSLSDQSHKQKTFFVRAYHNMCEHFAQKTQKKANRFH